MLENDSCKVYDINCIMALKMMMCNRYSDIQILPHTCVLRISPFPYRVYIYMYISFDFKYHIIHCGKKKTM